MNAAELEERLAVEADITHAAARRVLTALPDIIAEALRRGERVEIYRFGAFSLAVRKPCKGYDPSTGARYPSPRLVWPKFKQSKALKARLTGAFKPKK